MKLETSYCVWRLLGGSLIEAPLEQFIGLKLWLFCFWNSKDHDVGTFQTAAGHFKVEITRDKSTNNSSLLVLVDEVIHYEIIGDDNILDFYGQLNKELFENYRVPLLYINVEKETDNQFGVFYPTSSEGVYLRNHFTNIGYVSMSSSREIWAHIVCPTIMYLTPDGKIGYDGDVYLFPHYKERTIQE